MDWQKIIIHHSASPTEVQRLGKTIKVDSAMIRNWHKTKGWSDIGYHFVIMPDGRCENGRPLDRAGAHCKSSQRNFIGIGICLVGNFSETKVPGPQFDGLVNKVVQLLKAYQLGIQAVELHRDVPGAVTECPGRCFPENLLRNKLEESFS